MEDLIRSITINSNDYDKKYTKPKINSDKELPLNKTIEIPSMIIVIKTVLYENNKYYPQVFLDEWFNKLFSQKKRKCNNCKKTKNKNTYYHFTSQITD